MVAHQLSLAVAESLTCGLIQAEIGKISGASKFFLGGATTYSIPSKVDMLGVDKVHAESVNAVSSRVASEMASGVRHLFGASIGLSTTGYAEAYPEENIETPMAFIGLHILTPTNIKSSFKKVVDDKSRDRTQMREFVRDEALQFLMEQLNITEI